MWTKYEVQMDFLTQLCGSVPANPELMQKWLESRKPKVKPPNSKSINEIAEEVLSTTEDDPESRGLLVFQRHEGGLAVRAGTIRAHIKDKARVLSSLWVGKIEGEKSFAVKVQNAVTYDRHVYWLPILSQLDDKVIAQPTGARDKAIRSMTPRGPISAIKTIEYVENARLRVPLLVLTTPQGKPVVSVKDLEHLFDYGGTAGYGGERSDGEGRYVATIRQIED